ncbi:MAG: cupin domain-containing protein [Monoglobales bacterium]
MNKVFSIASNHPPKDGLTISTSLNLESETAVTFFSLGKDTDITPESYSSPIIYIGAGGSGEFVVGEEYKSIAFGSGDMLIAQKDTICGSKTEEGLVYTEIFPGKEITMNKALKAGEVIKLAELVPYEDGSIVNMDIASNDTMKFVVMAFDKGRALSPHRAPGDALIFALEGSAVIGYEGVEHTIHAGENFRFEKGGLHSVNAIEKFKMVLLITLK